MVQCADCDDPSRTAERQAPVLQRGGSGEERGRLLELREARKDTDIAGGRFAGERDSVREAAGEAGVGACTTAM